MSELGKSGSHSFHTREEVCRTVAYVIASNVTVVMKMSALVMVQIQISPAFIRYSVRNKMSFCTGNIFTMAQGLAKSVRLFH
jgi:hypothetical protein